MAYIDSPEFLAKAPPEIVAFKRQQRQELIDSLGLEDTYDIDGSESYPDDTMQNGTQGHGFELTV